MKVKHITKLTKPGKVRAFLTIELPAGYVLQEPMTIRDAKLIKNDNGMFFVGLPSRKYTDKEGQEKWTNILEMGWKDKEQMVTPAISAYQGEEDEPEGNAPF